MTITFAVTLIVPITATAAFSVSVNFTVSYNVTNTDTGTVSPVLIRQRKHSGH